MSISIATAIIFYSCKKPFVPVVTNNYTNILVVEGIINVGGIDSIFIKLSRTGNVNNATPNPETKAAVTVENAQGTVLSLTETAGGTYASPPIGLDNTKQYRLRIKTAGGVVYLSDFVDAKISPPIDSVGFKPTATGIQIYANTHDPGNNTHFYKYTYRETWQFTARYPSDYVVKLINDTLKVVERLPSEQVFYCFGSDSSSHTIVNSTAALAQDIVYQFPIITINSTSEKIETKYSILLTQQALTKEGFEFYENLQKNTENLGSIFDAQPSQLIGNIHNVADATEPVIGYITAGNTQQKRIFIKKTQLPDSFITVYPFSCQIDSIYNEPCDKPGLHPLKICKDLTPGPPVVTLDQPLTPFTAAGETGYLGSANICSECTLRGHVAQPVFWK